MLGPTDTLEPIAHPRESPPRPTDWGRCRNTGPFCYGWTATHRALPLPGQVGSVWRFLPGFCLCYLARGRRHLAFRHSSLGHLSFQFVHMGSALRSCGPRKARLVGLLTHDGQSHQNLAWAGTAGSLEGRHTLKPKQPQARQNWLSSP